MAVHLQFPPDTLTEFCRRWRVRTLAVFGSALRDDFGPESDVDFLVQFEPGARWDLWDLSDMHDELAALIGRPVDLVEEEALRNPYRKREILATREVVYAA